jgi:hypothetical protein
MPLQSYYFGYPLRADDMADVRVSGAALPLAAARPLVDTCEPLGPASFAG